MQGLTATASLSRLGRQVQDRYDYVDVLQVWLQQPLSDRDRHSLNAHTSKLRLGRQLGVTEPAWWNRHYRQLVRLYQPYREAIEFLAKRDDVLITYFEPARDYIFGDQEQVQEALRLTRQHFCQRWHRTRKFTIFSSGNWRSGDPYKRGMVFQGYGDRPSKVTGEVECLHLEAKIAGSATIKRIGIEHPKDLLDFDVEAFWRRYLRHLDVDRRRLGCWWINKVDKTKKRVPKVVNGFDVNRATGNYLCRRYATDENEGFVMQKLIDELGSGPWIKQMPLLMQTDSKNSQSQHQNRKLDQGDGAIDGFVHIT